MRRLLIPNIDLLVKIYLMRNVAMSESELPMMAYSPVYTETINVCGVGPACAIR
jgi:hypothetical protein